MLFALLPLILVGGGYWYVTGGQAVSMDDAYVESDKVGVSADVAGIVRGHDKIGATAYAKLDETCTLDSKTTLVLCGLAEN